MGNKDRYSEWLYNSFGLTHIEILLINDAQGLGILDVELIEEFPKIKIDSELEEDLSRKYRHMLISKLWVIGAYELIRLINKMMPKEMDIYKEHTKEKLKEVLSLFTEVRVPLTKFQERGQQRLYSGVAQFKVDSIKGVGWEILFSNKKGIETKRFYRKDLGDSLLELLKQLRRDIEIASSSP